MSRIFFVNSKIEPRMKNHCGEWVGFHLEPRSIDLSRIPVNKGTNSRLGWRKCSDLFEIVHLSLVLISLCLLTGV